MTYFQWYNHKILVLSRIAQICKMNKININNALDEAIISKGVFHVYIYHTYKQALLDAFNGLSRHPHRSPRDRL